MSTYNSTNSAPVNVHSLDFYYKTKNFIDTLAPQSECYLTLKAYVKTMWLERKHQWARNYTSKQTNLHKDTISAHNMILEANGILKIDRAFKQNNIFSTKYLFVLAVLFGYLESASLFTPFMNINLSSNNVEGNSTMKEKESLTQKGKNEENCAKSVKFPSNSECCIAPVLCPCNVNLLFEDHICKEFTDYNIMLRRAPILAERALRLEEIKNAPPRFEPSEDIKNKFMAMLEPQKKVEHNI